MKLGSEVEVMAAKRGRGKKEGWRGILLENLESQG